ncbi:hypothetical protein TEA_028463 [Camellia sinensis var. sinensis]|uniref:F-box domain-containing protein n=1 Tax=Camellia sinensis var. sinensis TaxID=542762 RepID=A0A4S4CVS3_CAMSN|nr:hypothetical protein TEA_028463 [Camellia sinensis var. sinensis]
MIDCSRDNIGMETRETRDTEEEDRISNLPDSLLIHILSFLETRYAIRCSILSTKWRNLWASVPNLIFHIDSHSNRYFDFIDRVLLVHDLPQILSFTFTGKSWVDIEPNRFNSWICAAIKRRVRDIHVDFSNEFRIQSLNFPRSFFSCETLVNLTLGFEACIISNLPNSTYFPNLKSLKICVAHPNDSLTPTLFSCCPLLEILYLRVRLEWTVHKQVVFNISTQSLRVFRLYLNKACSSPFDCGLKHKVVIDAPLLEDILLDDNFMACYSINNLSSSLEIAHVDVGLQHIYAKLMECDCANRALELVRGISQAKSLHLSFNTLQVLGCAEDIGQLTLWNLTRLELGVIYLSKVMLDLLSKMPNLESLKLIMDYECYYGNDEEKEFYRIQWHAVPCCLLSHLKVIEIYNFRGRENDLLLVEYFLKNAKNKGENQSSNGDNKEQISELESKNEDGHDDAEVEGQVGDELDKEGDMEEGRSVIKHDGHNDKDGQDRWTDAAVVNSTQIENEGNRRVDDEIVTPRFVRSLSGSEMNKPRLNIEVV